MLGRNYNELASIVALLRDNVCMESARIRSPGKTGFGPCPRRAPLRWNERARLPSADCVILVRSDELSGGEGAYLVVKATTAIEVVEECGVGFTPPKIHIGNLKITPDCV